MMNRVNIFFLVAVCFWVFETAAQDIIVKKDQTELKAKVLEIEETKIKYKLFEHQDGPTYNISKQDVFMIIYQDGKRETFSQTNIAQATTTTAPATSVNTATSTATQTSPQLAGAPPMHKSFWTVATNPDALSSVFNLAIVGENTLPISPNYLRGGFSTHFSAGKGFYGQTMMLHLTPYLPLNHVTGNYEDQDKGMFAFLRLGAGGGYTSFDQADLKTQWAFAHQVALGIEYYFTRKFGVVAYTDKFQSFSCGITLSFR